jgi:predicted HTH transcriptional regulator
MPTTKTEEDLLRLLHSEETTFVERKTIGDTRDIPKTIVAFANTLPPGQEGVLFIGATNAREIEAHSSSLDDMQKKLSERTKSIYPPVYFTATTIREDGKECLVVIVPGSASRPHFAGELFVRDLSKTVVASAEKYESMLAARTAKTFELQKWKGKHVTVRTMSRQAGIAYYIHDMRSPATLVSADQFYVTVDFGNRIVSHPLKRVQISYDNQAKRLELEVEDF